MVFNYRQAAMVRAAEQVEAAAAHRQGQVSPRTGVRNPVSVAAHGRMAEFVHNTRTAGRPENSQKQYEPKIKEFEHFCELNYPGDIYKHNIDATKMYSFMFYQAFREKKKTGGTKQQRADGPLFNQEEYQKLTAAFFNASTVAYPSPKNPMGPATFSAYKAVLKSLHTEQRTRGVCNLPWDLVWTLDCKNLQNHVKERLPALKKANYVEKVDGEFAPYAIVERYGDIEKVMWDDSQQSKGRRSVCSNLRHRACTLYLSTGILRSESIHKADISDFFGLKPPKKENDVHDMWLMIMQIAQGKTTRGKKQWGRATRHRQVELCCIGAIAHYLQYRIDSTNEFMDFTVGDWMDNKAWFDIKFLVDINGSDNTKEMCSDTYSDHVRKVLQRLNLPTNKLCHLGRNVGSKWLDLMEVDAEEIRRMGQWNNTVYDNSYSSKLPMNAMRNLAGYNSSNGLYYNTRTVVMPSQELCEMTPLGSFAYAALNELVATDLEGKHQTAYETLRFFCDLSVIFLQDAAAMMVLHPERSSHSVYDMMCFTSSEFQVCNVIRWSFGVCSCCCMVLLKNKCRLSVTNNRNSKNACELR
jgi:Centromere DNA-binding protein complex CBF3 subunit, domain 2